MKLVTVHGGHNNVAVGARGNDYKEEVLANELAKLVASKLEGCHFIKQDRGNVNQNLNYLVNEMDKHPGPNLSIHFNAFPDPKANGTECFAKSSNTEGKKIASKMSEAVAKVLGTTNRKQKSAPLFVIDYSKDTTLLLEVCFITNSNDMKQYVANKDKVADAIAKCYSNYKTKGKPSEKPVDKPVESTNKLPKGFTSEKAKFTVTTPDGIQVRKGSHGLKATKGGILKKGDSINYDSWASKDGYIWVHYVGYSGDDLYLPVREVGGKAWGNFS